MSYINSYYIHVIDESVTRSVSVSEHAVETKTNTTDHVKPESVELSLTGKIVGKDAAITLSKIKKLMTDGNTVNYIGRNIFRNALITSFNSSHPNTNWGGLDFDMTLKEIRIANPSYRTETRFSSGTQQIQLKAKVSASTVVKVYHTVKKGDTVYRLIQAQNAPYKNYGFTINDVMKNNPTAFSVAGDFGTLKVGVKLWVGTR